MLDTYFKEYFWTFHLLVLGLAGFLLARTANTFIGHSLRLAPAQAAAARSETAPEDPNQAQKSTVPTQAFLDKNVFRAEREDLTPPPPEPVAADTNTFDNNSCEKSQMRVNLVATIVSSNPESSLAVFVDPSKNEPVSHSVGERVLEEASVKEIEWRRVLVDHNGKCEFFSIEAEAPPAPPGSNPVAIAEPEVAPPKGGDPPDMKIGANVRKMSEREYEIPKDEIDNVLGNLNVVATQARIVPSFQNGKANGFKLFSIRPDSLYSKIGIQNGDIIQKINGYEINSPDKALEIYSKLKDATSITVDLIRRGKTETLSYNIR